MASGGSGDPPAPRLRSPAGPKTAVSVVSMGVRQLIPDLAGSPDLLAAARELAPDVEPDELFPLAETWLDLEITGVPTAVPHALMRVMMGELNGYRLTFQHADFGYAGCDPYMDEGFLRLRVEHVPIRRIPDDVAKRWTFRLDVTNTTADTMVVYTNDLEAISAGDGGDRPPTLFNPTIELAELQPGAHLLIEKISFVGGWGRDHSGNSPAVRGNHRSLDVPQYSDDEIRGKGGGAAAKSGYRVSSFLADPQHHRVSVLAAAVPRKNPGEVAAVALDACLAIERRFRLIEKIVQEARGADVVMYKGTEATFQVEQVQKEVPPTPAAAAAAADMSSVSATSAVAAPPPRICPDERETIEVARGTLVVRERTANTDTVGNLLCATANATIPNLDFVKYECPRHEGVMRFVLDLRGVEDDREVATEVLGIIKHILRTFDIIRRGVAAKTV